MKDLEREFVLRWNREKDDAKTTAIGKWKAQDIVGIWICMLELRGVVRVA